MVEGTVARRLPAGIDPVSASSSGSGARGGAKRAPERDAARAAAEGSTRSQETAAAAAGASPPPLPLLLLSSPLSFPFSSLRATGATTNSHPGPRNATGNPEGSIAVATSDTGPPPPPARGTKTGNGAPTLTTPTWLVIDSSRSPACAWMTSQSSAEAGDTETRVALGGGRGGAGGGEGEEAEEEEAPPSSLLLSRSGLTSTVAPSLMFKRAAREAGTPRKGAAPPGVAPPPHATQKRCC